MTKKEHNRLQHEVAKPAYDALMKYYPLTLEDLDGEIWKPIPDYEQLYHGSNFGRVKSFWKGKAKILKPFLANTYLQITLCKNNEKKKVQIHRLVARAFIDNPDMKPQVNHKDGNTLNNYVGNLEWATAAENQQHAYDTGLAKSGEEHYKAKLTNEQVVYIRENPDNLTGRYLAKRFGVHFNVVSSIQLGKIYKQAGGTIRKKQKFGEYHRIPEEIREQIRAEYVKGSKEFGAPALARKYGVSKTTILNIVHET